MSKKRKTRPARSMKAERVGSTSLRVIGGRLRGQRFEYTGDPVTRPMKQRVREAVFNLVGPAVRGTHVIDLFAGTGALSWEALSRGAHSATLVERHFPTARIIRKNAQSLGLAERIETVAGDTFIWARQLDPTSLPQDRRWLVFCSPPYDFYVERKDSLIRLLKSMLLPAPAESMIVVECDQRFDAVADLPGPASWDIRTYSPAVVAILTTESVTE